MKRELDDVEKQLRTTRKQLEEETLQRVDLQNRVQSLKEELDFRSQMHAQVTTPTRFLSSFAPNRSALVTSDSHAVATGILFCSSRSRKVRDAC